MISVFSWVLQIIVLDPRLKLIGFQTTGSLVLLWFWINLHLWCILCSSFANFWFIFHRTPNQLTRGVWYHLPDWVRSSWSSDRPRDYPFQSSASSAERNRGGWAHNLSGITIIFRESRWYLYFCVFLFLHFMTWIQYVFMNTIWF